MSNALSIANTKLDQDVFDEHDPPSSPICNFVANNSPLLLVNMTTGN